MPLRISTAWIRPDFEFDGRSIWVISPVIMACDPSPILVKTFSFELLLYFVLRQE